MGRTNKNGTQDTMAEQVTETENLMEEKADTDTNTQETYQFSKADFEKVKAHIENVKAEKEEAIVLAQRLQADFDNYRKRNAALRAESYDEGKRDCIKTLLPILDNFERALQNIDGVDESYVEGIRLLNKLLLDTLSKQGLGEIPAQGLFDPNLHDAVMQEAVPGRNTGEILEVLQTGYEVNGKILRHSMVKVAE